MRYRPFFSSVFQRFSTRSEPGHFIVLRCSFLWWKYDNMWPSFVLAWDDMCELVSKWNERFSYKWPAYSNSLNDNGVDFYPIGLIKKLSHFSCLVLTVTQLAGHFSLLNELALSIKLDWCNYEQREAIEAKEKHKILKRKNSFSCYGWESFLFFNRPHSLISRDFKWEQENSFSWIFD